MGHSQTMNEYFKTIDVDPSEAKGLFELLDTDNSGGVDTSEMVNGFLRLRGPAKALDIALLIREFTKYQRQFAEHHSLVEAGLARMAGGLLTVLNEEDCIDTSNLERV